MTMSTKTDTTAQVKQTALSSPHLIDLDAEPSDFAADADRVVQLSPGRPVESEQEEATRIVEMPQNADRRDDLREAA